MPSTKYTVELSEVAERTYLRLADEAQVCIDRGDKANSKVKLFRMVEEALDKIIPQDPFAPERSLSGILSGYYRVKKGRLRICYIGNSSTKRIKVLYISDTPRKEGDRNDPYKVLTRMVKSGRCEDLLEGLGVKKRLKRTIELSTEVESSLIQ